MVCSSGRNSRKCARKPEWMDIEFLSQIKHKNEVCKDRSGDRLLESNTKTLPRHVEMEL